MAVRIESQAEPIPGYRLIERLGGGGFGEVWKAEAPGGLLKAMKFVYGDLQTVDNVDTARAEQELKALSRVKAVRHPFILSLERYDIIDGQLIIVSELADRNLWDRYRECRAQGLPGIPRPELLRYMTEVAEALDHMNLELDLMHLDIKPQNLFLVQNHMKVADFGLVKDLEGLVASVTGGVTPVYAAPETFEGYVSRYSDQYSLAIVYQELLTSKRPFIANNTRQLILKHLQEAPDLSPLQPCDHPAMARALAKDPQARFPCSQEFIRTLRHGDSTGGPESAQQLQDTPLGTPTTLPPDGLPGAPGFAEEEDGPLTPTSSPILTPTGKGAHVPGHYGPVSTLTAAQLVREECGEGVLVPALVVGLGQVGRLVLERLRHELRERYRDLRSLPHLRLLAIDTDTEALTQPGVEPLSADETLTARLNRASRYLRVRDSLPPLDDWLHRNMLYRIPRTLVTTGIRALGRLAFIDHYRSIFSRLRWELEQITAPEALRQAGEHTGLGLRSNWPRVYVIASLGGGTGSGMFLDVAYNVRALLREWGLPRQDVIGVLAVPAVDEDGGQELALANCYAALTELRYFMAAARTFRARYVAREAPLEVPGVPFSRCALLPLAGADGPEPLLRLAALAGDWLHRQLLTPLGRAADDERATLLRQAVEDAEADAERPPPYQSFGMHVLGLPRRELLRRAASKIGKTFAFQWAAKGLPDQGPHFQQQMQQYCHDLGIDPPAILQRLIAVSTETLGMAPDVAFARWLEPFRSLPGDALPPPDLFRALVQELERTVGAHDPLREQGPQAQTMVGNVPALLPVALRDAADKLTNSGEPVLVERVLHFVELPGFRLGAAEEAINQTVALFEDWLTGLEQQHDQIVQELNDLPERCRKDLAECERLWERLQRGTKPSAPQRLLACTTVPERLQHYAILRFQHLSLQWALTVYRSLRGRLSDQKKEIGFCRSRLRDLQKAFEDNSAGATAPLGDSQRTWLLPANCPSLEAAVQAAVRALVADDWAALDQRLQAAIQHELVGLHRVCLMPGHQHFERLQNVMLRETERFLSERLRYDDAAALFLAQHADEAARGAELENIRAHTLPALHRDDPDAPGEVDIVVAPATAAGQALAEAVQALNPQCRIVTDSNPEEITIYREAVGIGLGDLPQLGSIARRAYEGACAVEFFTPHTRLDIPAWTPACKAGS